MSFDPGAQLDPGQVRDVRGRTGGGRGPTLAVGGGGLGLILAIAYILLGGNPADLISSGSGGGAVQGENQTLQQECKTGADANEREDCRIVGYVNSIQGYWAQALPQDGNTQFVPAETWIFSDVVDTACGTASSQVGPFYCPNDRAVYLDLGFFQLLTSRFGAQGGRFAEAYVVAHEYGHHIENLLGVLQQQTGDTGPDSPAVKIELMADCLAGVWAKHAPAPVNEVTQQDIRQAIDAAQAVGDDRIQETTQGRVIPENFTHGTSEQRQQWFQRGFQDGTLNACNTFA